jgi:hypothetical protein
MNAQELKELFRYLTPWSEREDLTKKEWDNYLQVARVVQQSTPQVVESALELFMQEAIQEEFKGYESESKLFVLMRVLFDLPEAVPENQRQCFKGWINWPKADSNGQVSLVWPILWQSARPALLAPYEGSEGLPYAAVAEYRYFLTHFSYRQLD